MTEKHKKQPSEKPATDKVKLEDLELNPETVQDLTEQEGSGVRGGRLRRASEACQTYEC